MAMTIPSRLRELLMDSEWESGVLGFASGCERVLRDNKMPFFPAYTDHGVAHVDAVLDAAVRLIPAGVWEEELLRSADAGVLIGSCLLHDLAMHLREPGFLYLVSRDTEFKPLPWFDEERRGRHADIPWPDLWQSFRKEARRFSPSQLERIFGPSVSTAPAIAFGDADADPQAWTEVDRLLVGEFLRRHHARLAHEIAIYGFPGIEEKHFPVLARSLPELADPIGATARSHNEDLRVAADYLDYLAPGDLRPGGSLQLYLMGLLRIADYFQIDASRATPLLLHLRDPQSPTSVDEWEKHQAISDVSWDNRDLQAAMIRVTPAHTLRTHLQLSELIAGLQRELDVTAAVLSETYGASGLSALQLTLQRVKTNLHEPALHRQLSFIPRRARLRSAEDLFRLVVGDLYGDEPAVAGRELLQNAADAVRELRRWLERTGRSREEIETYDLPADVLVEVEELSDDAGLLRVVDRGIGMNDAIIVDSFLTAGATFREPIDDEELDPAAALRWMKTGRFGVGVFASYLLGNEVRVTTRHAGAVKGITFTAGLGNDLVQMDWAEDVPVGTEIVIGFDFDRLPVPYEWKGNRMQRYLEFLEQVAGFYQLTEPTARFRLKTRAGEIHDHEFEPEIPPPGPLPDTWREIEVAGFDRILWTLPLPLHGFRFGAFPSWRGFDVNVAHNGFVIRKVGGSPGEEIYEWVDTNMRRLLAKPSIAVFDSQHKLGIALNRYELTDTALDFEDVLQRSIGMDVVAHALVCGAVRHPLGSDWGLQPIVVGSKYLPLIPALTDRYLLDEDLVVIWMDEADQEGVAENGPGELFSGMASAWVALPYEELFVQDDFRDEGEAFGSDEKMRQATISLGLLLGREPVAGIQVAGGEMASIPLEEVDQQTQGKLLSLAREVSVGPLGSALPSGFGLAVLRAAGNAAQPRNETLAEPWMELIGGLLERDQDKRDSAVPGLRQADEELGAMVDVWSRHSAED